MRKTLEKHIEECPKHPLSMARNRIMELEAENKRLQMMNPCNHTGYEAATCDVCGYPDPRKLIAKLEEENQRLMDEIRDLEWKIYRPLKEGEMTQEGDQVLGPEEDAKWEPVAGNYRPAPSPLYPAHCQYRRPIVDELRKEMEGDYFYRKCVAGKESARSKRIKELEAERDADRRREYGYSQQTVDALTLERDKLRAERNDWIARYQSVSEMHDALIKEYNEGRAENKRLREALKGFLQEAIVLTDDYLSMFETYHDTHVIQGWDKARWVRVSQAARDAREALKEASDGLAAENR